MGKLEEIEKKFGDYFKLFTDESHIPEEFFIKKAEFQYLLSTIHRLRGAIEKHKNSLAVYFYRDCTATLQQGVEYDRDEELYKNLEDL